MLVCLHTTSTGPSQLYSLVPPTRVPVFCQPITHLINLSLTSSTIPIQWSKHPSDLCQKSSHPKLTQTSYRPPTMSIEEQYAFCSTGSTIQLYSFTSFRLFHTAHAHITNTYVTILCLDYSKASDILHSWRSSNNLTYQLMYATGCVTSSMATHTALSIKDIPHHCIPSQLASYKVLWEAVLLNNQ